jgi:hypothetical protein
MDQHTNTFLRVGAMCAIVGSIIYMVANLAHPRSPNIESTPAQIETVAHSDIWVTDHLAVFFGGFLMLFGLMALTRMLHDGPSAPWAKFGQASAMVSTSVWAVLMAVDGIASKVVHVGWAVAPVAEKAMALRVASMMEEIDISIFSMYIIVFFGFTYLLYGLAVTKSAVFPRWLGWVAVLLGLASLIDGTVQGLTGLSVLVTNTLFATFASLLTVWTIVMGVLMWRKTKRPIPVM